MAGRFIRSRDIEFFDTINKELVGDPIKNKSGIINQEILAFKVSVYETKTNLYGESSSGRTYQKGVKLNCIIEADDFDYDINEFGPDVNYNASFSFLRSSLIEANYVPDLGDLIKWNYAHWEVNEINENQLVGGMQDQNHSVVCTAHITEISRLNIERVRS